MATATTPLPTDYEHFRVDPMTPRFGAEVVGFDMGRADEDSAKASNDYETRRRVERVTLAGDEPF